MSFCPTGRFIFLLINTLYLSQMYSDIGPTTKKLSAEHMSLNDDAFNTAKTRYCPADASTYSSISISAHLFDNQNLDCNTACTSFSRLSIVQTRDEKDAQLEKPLVQMLLDKVLLIVNFLPMKLVTIIQLLGNFGVFTDIHSLYKAFKDLEAYLPQAMTLSSISNEQEISECELQYLDTNILEEWSFISGYNNDRDKTKSAISQQAKFKVKDKKNSKREDIYDELLSLVNDKSSVMEVLSNQLLQLVQSPTALDSLVRERALSQRKERPYTEICPYNSRDECIKKGRRDCRRKLHFEPIILANTDPTLGDCSYLDTCYKGKGCRYVHYRIVFPDKSEMRDKKDKLISSDSKFCQSFFTLGESISLRTTLAPQWLCCDIRHLDLKLLGDFAVIIADPPWDIHMNLPYGVISDEYGLYSFQWRPQKITLAILTCSEMLSFKMNEIQTEGVFFLWVTGRALDIGRQCLRNWGYDRIDEVIWCKTNQLGRTICTGRTGHWLNHSKEHVLVGTKGSPVWLSRGLDIDTIVSATRDKSHKPDELYEIAERLVGTASRKLELFGRKHNLRPGWLTVGNQLDGSNLLEEKLVGVVQ